jgi:hypothetical protein
VLKPNIFCIFCSIADLPLKQQIMMHIKIAAITALPTPVVIRRRIILLCDDGRSKTM